MCEGVYYLIDTVYLGEYFVCTSKKCVFCYCWVECLYKCQLDPVGWCCSVPLYLYRFYLGWSTSSVDYWEKTVEASNFSFRFVSFSFSSVSFWFVYFEALFFGAYTFKIISSRRVTHLLCVMSLIVAGNFLHSEVWY